MPEHQTITHYHSPSSYDMPQAPADAGLVKEVVRCVASFFQKGVVDQISLISSHVLINNGKGYTYEVKFLRGGRTLKRRFTVYRLGGTHSKSVCYQVTDPKGKYMVVKIPPQMITDLNAYLTAVAHERQLAKKLFEVGIKVVVPSISTVMKHLHKLDFAKKVSLYEVEDAYSDILLLSGDKYIDKFKIGGSYVFFMEFLDEPFLGKVVREFYNKETLANLKCQYFERDLVLLNNHDRIGFMSEYKHIGTMKYLYDVYSGLHDIFEDFCAKVDSVLSLYSISLGIGKKKDWFIASGFGKLIDESSFLELMTLDYGDKGLVINRLNTLLNQTVESSELFKLYLDILDQEAYWTAFKDSVGKMKMIGNKLLILLVMLQQMGLVLRDLKVDNLFIADDENMELGVIDLETGGYIGSGTLEGIVPAGMPSNMTISNLLFVSQLKRIYGEEKVSTILHMQDWYATISMMFETNIGSILFDEARNYILKINKEIDERLDANYNDFVGNNPDVSVTPKMIENFFSLSDEDVKGHTWEFWNVAEQNLKRKCLANKSKLKRINYVLPLELKNKLISNINEEMKQIQDKYRSYKMTAASIDYFNKPTTTIAVLQNNLVIKEQLYAVKKNHPSTKYKMKVKLAQEIDIYKACIIQKQKQVELITKINILNQEHISAFDLFPIMLHLIIRVMRKDEWFKYSSKALNSISNENKYSNSQSINTTEGWKSTIIVPQNALAKRTNY
ncbi:MAG: hypothetical protein KJ630_24765 [Proteobacteria bacterium]|nr:hypothetical protein [Pseudomonadota bacterium]